MPRFRQNGAYQRCGAVNCRLRSPLAHDEANLPLSEPVKGVTLTSKLPGIWRMSVEELPVLYAGASDAGLTDPAQHTAVSFADITLLMIGDSTVFDDIVIGKIVALLEAEILRELGKADRKLRQDYRRHRANSL